MSDYYSDVFLGGGSRCGGCGRPIEDGDTCAECAALAEIEKAREDGDLDGVEYERARAAVEREYRRLGRGSHGQ